VKGTDTVAIERIVRKPDGVRGELVVRNQPRIVWHQQVGASNATGPFDLEVYAATAGAGASPLQSMTLRMASDSGFVDMHTNGATNTTQRLPVPAGAEWMWNSSVLHTDVLSSLARARKEAHIIVVLAQGGTQIPITITAAGDTTIANIAGNPARFVHDALGLKVADLGGGMLVHRATADEGKTLSKKIAVEKPSYAAPSGAPYSAEDVSVKTAGGYELAGTLTRPRGMPRVPVVVTITGSGPQERDERIPGVDGYALFRDIADTLGRRGIAVMRVDDRGIGASTGLETRAVATSADYANDVRAVVMYLRTRKDIDTTRIALLGHSEGGMIAPMVASQDQGIRAIVLLAGAAYGGRQVMLFQNQDAVDHAPNLTKAQRDSIMATVPAALDSAGRAYPWLGFFMQHDPLKTARRVTQPTLILQGGTDHQVTPEQADSLEAAMKTAGNTDVTKRIFPDTDHLFLADPSGAPGGYAGLPSKKVRREVLGAIADWLVVRLK
jgi:dienelactone hydrolase